MQNMTYIVLKINIKTWKKLILFETYKIVKRIDKMKRISSIKFFKTNE